MREGCFYQTRNAWAEGSSLDSKVMWNNLNSSWHRPLVRYSWIDQYSVVSRVIKYT